ncbi:hypothetical protein EKH79_16560 [Dyella dinghuensis]|uniref:Uncharacterized protein n=1 Tax=Dyella dinghuensis TaxID=1920169 RepID=A0A432LQM5_9GAMM|nr:hypothetical protein [Dyella dinghuensis]RUL62479.1 hypothetical protein EKH79_16560 [Dyella dinghuensis]
MHLRWITMGLLCIPCLAMAQSVHRFKLFNDMPSEIVSFTVSQAGGESSAKLVFDDPDRPFKYGAATMIDVHGGNGCLFDLQTRLSTGERVTTRNVDLCAIRVYRPGLRIDAVHFGSPWAP